MSSFTDATIADMRAHGGKVTEGPLAGRPTLILTTTGAKTCTKRTTPVNYSRDGDRYVIAATKGGAPTHPAWYHNLTAHPRVTIEVDGESFEALARVSDGAERERLWNGHVRLLPNFAEYPGKTSRVIPVVTLERAG